MSNFLIFFCKNRIATLSFNILGFIIFKDKFCRILEITECYKQSHFDLEIQSKDAIKDIMDLEFKYWESLLAIGIAMKILNINDFNYKEE